MKRFYKAVASVSSETGFALHLDGRPVKTPAKRPFIVPGAGLAAAIVTEWEAQGEKIDPETMPLTRLSNGAIDRVMGHGDVIVEEILRYGETDLLCYRAQGPHSLIAVQAQTWDPLLSWAKDVLDVDLPVQNGIMPVAVSQQAQNQLYRAVAGLDSFCLAGLGALVAASGSLIIGLAVLYGHIRGKEAANCAFLDDVYQLERWGEDEDALARLKTKRADIKAAAQMLALLGNQV